jgi:hypothetical protein
VEGKPITIWSQSILGISAVNLLVLLLSFQTNPHWARVVGYGPFSGDINGLMMEMMI